MELQKTYKWIADADFQQANPQHFVIMAITQDEGDIIMQMSGACGFRQISLWGENQNKLIDAFGGNTDKWIGKKLSISQNQTLNGKKVKLIEISKAQ